MMNMFRLGDLEASPLSTLKVWRTRRQQKRAAMGLKLMVAEFELIFPSLNELILPLPESTWGNQRELSSVCLLYFS